MTITPVAKHLVVELSLPVLTTCVCCGWDSDIQPTACKANTLTDCATAALVLKYTMYMYYENLMDFLLKSFTTSTSISEKKKQKRVTSWISSKPFLYQSLLLSSLSSYWRSFASGEVSVHGPKLIHMPIHVLYTKTLEYLVLFPFRTNVYNVVYGLRCVYQIGVQFH